MALVTEMITEEIQMHSLVAVKSNLAMHKA